GDMLFMPSGRPEPYRIHGAYVSEDESARVVEFWKTETDAAAAPAPLATSPQLVEADDEALAGEEGGDDDELIRQAAQLVVTHQRGSTSLLQRRLKVGYSRAGRLMDQLEQLGVVGPFQGSKARDVLVDVVLGTGQWREVVQAARHVLGGAEGRWAKRDYPGGALDTLTPRALSTPRHLAYLKISEGCDHRCTFCIIPRLRGDQQSRAIEDLVEEAERLAALGVRELNLIGQDTTGYGTDLPGKPTLADLLEALDRVEGIAWIRVQYTYPRLWSDRLISVWASARRVVPYVDIPLQHIAHDMLRRMGRAMSARDTRALVQRIKAGIPGVA